MSVTDPDPQRAAMPENGDPGGRLSALERELRLMREEFAKMRDLILEWEKSGRTLINTYREVIADFADLFGNQRKDTLKRGDSLCFCLHSIRDRIREDIRAELGTDAARTQAARNVTLPPRRIGFPRGWNAACRRSYSV